jgi:hypothetical protein
MIRKLMPSCPDGILCSAKEYWAGGGWRLSNLLLQHLAYQRKFPGL